MTRPPDREPAGDSAAARPSRPDPAAAPEREPPGDSRWLTPEELRAEIEAAQAWRPDDPAQTRPNPSNVTAAQAGWPDDPAQTRPSPSKVTAAQPDQNSYGTWGLEFERSGLARTAPRLREVALKIMWLLPIGAFFLWSIDYYRPMWWVQATVLAVVLGLAAVVMVRFHFEGRPFDLVPARRIRLILAPGRLIWRTRSPGRDEVKIFPLEDITGLYQLRPYSREPGEMLLGLGCRSGPDESRHKLLEDHGRPDTCVRVGELIQAALPRAVPVYQLPAYQTDTRAGQPETWGTLFPLDQGGGAPASAPPGAKILTAEELGPLPPLTGPQAEPGAAPAWGVEFDQRHFGLALSNLIISPLFLTPLAGAAWFYTHKGAELISWLHILASLLPMAYCSAISYALARNIDRYLSQRVRLIFPPGGGFIWRARTFLSRREMIFGPGQITRLIHSLPQGGQYDARHLCLFYRRPAGPRRPGRDDGRPSAPGRENFLDLLYDRGWKGTCAWAAGQIRKALTPGTFTFEDRPIVERPPEDYLRNPYRN